ncbi:N-acetyllactosaminide 3-alpha-galactosyltransferase, partial [Teladorsagia circumcincta]
MESIEEDTRSVQDGTSKSEEKGVNSLVGQRFGTVKYRNQIHESFITVTCGNPVLRSWSEEPFTLKRLAVQKYITVPNSCLCERAYYVVIVHVQANDLKTRQEWRNTYGRLQNEFNFALIFVTGTAGTQSSNDVLKYEASMYRDILQVDTIDTYRNLVLKNVAALRYIAAACTNVQAVVKVDDNVAWNIEMSKTVIHAAIQDEKIYCRWSSPKNKPSHCLGIAYVLPRTAVLRMLNVISEEQVYG